MKLSLMYKLAKKLPYTRLLERQNESLKAEIQARDNFTDKCLDENDELSKKIEELQVRIEGENNLRDEIASGQNTIYDLHRQIDWLTMENNDLIEKINELQEENTKVIQAMNKKRDEYKYKMRELLVTQDSLNASSNTWNKRWQDEHEKYDDLRMEVRSYVNSIDSFLEGIQSFRDALMATASIDT